MNQNNRKRCPDCRILLKKQFTCKANIENIPLGETVGYPTSWFDAIWTGDYICPRCKIIVKEAK